MLGAAIALAGAACGLDTSSQGGASGAKPGQDRGETEDGTSTTALPTDGANTDPTGNDQTGATSTGEPDDGTTAGASTGRAVDPCDDPPQVTIELDLSAASLDEAMNEGSIPAVGTYAYSEQAGAGTVSFDFELMCEDEYRVWAQVHDPEAGNRDLGSYIDPDSFAVSIDERATVQWWFGCQMSGTNPRGGAAWQWLSVRGSQFCTPTDYRPVLTAGAHQLHLTNLEAGVHQVSGDEIGYVAAVSRVVITNDPGYAP